MPELVPIVRHGRYHVDAGGLALEKRNAYTSSWRELLPCCKVDALAYAATCQDLIAGNAVNQETLLHAFFTPHVPLASNL